MGELKRALQLEEVRQPLHSAPAASEPQLCLCSPRPEPRTLCGPKVSILENE